MNCLGVVSLLLIIFSLPFSIPALVLIFIIGLFFPETFTKEWFHMLHDLTPCSGGGWETIQVLLHLSVLCGIFINTQILFHYHKKIFSRWNKKETEIVNK
jgi:hypothetical protein